jgi:hypothetical protein
MARISTFRLYRLRLAAWRPPPWQIGILLVLDLAETIASAALAMAAPAPAVPAHAPYVAVDVPPLPQALSTSVALLGVMVGLLMGVSLVYELVLAYRRSRYPLSVTRRRRSPSIQRPRRATASPRTRDDHGEEGPMQRRVPGPWLSP